MHNLHTDTVLQLHSSLLPCRFVSCHAPTLDAIAQCSEEGEACRGLMEVTAALGKLDVVGSSVCAMSLDPQAVSK